MFRGPVYAGAVWFVAVFAMTTGCRRKIVTHTPAPARTGATETGMASWYGAPYHGRATASGEIYDQGQFTAAHRTLPFETWVEVTNLGNGKQVEVRITDRGPFVGGRIIDLSLAAAREIDMVRAGTARVRLRVIEAPTPGTVAAPPAAVAPVLSPVLPEGYAVQAGAFSSCDRAAAFAQMLADARVVETGAVCRVLVGRHLSLADAKQLAEKVRTQTGEAIVVPDR